MALTDYFRDLSDQAVAAGNTDLASVVARLAEGCILLAERLEAPDSASTVDGTVAGDV